MSTMFCDHDPPLCRPGDYTLDQCRACWLAEYDPGHASWKNKPNVLTTILNQHAAEAIKRDEGPQPEPDVIVESKPQQFPSVFKQAANFITSAVEHVTTGMHQTEPDELNRRMSLCMACDRWKDDRCLECGCFVRAKAAWKEQKCPIGKW